MKLYQKCANCEAKGYVPAVTRNGNPFSQACPACKGERFIHFGLTSRQVEVTLLRLAKLWLAVKAFDRIGFEGSQLLEEMSEARMLLDAYYGSDVWRK